MNGVIVRIVAEKGFGFVRGEDGIERFFHRSGVTDGVFDSLTEKDPVTFDDEAGDRGPRASNIRLR